MARTVLTEEERLYIKALALELAETRKLLNQLIENLAKLNDKQFMKLFNASKGDVSEKQVDNYQLALQKQADAAESEFR